MLKIPGDPPTFRRDVPVAVLLVCRTNGEDVKARARVTPCWKKQTPIVRLIRHTIVVVLVITVLLQCVCRCVCPLLVCVVLLLLVGPPVVVVVVVGFISLDVCIVACLLVLMYYAVVLN